MRNRTALTCTGALLAGLCPLIATAQDAFTLDEIVVSADFEPVEAEKNAASVVVVTEDEIKATAETRVTDLLGNLPGVNVTSQGPIGARSGLTIRGVGQNYIAVRIDGIDVTDPSGPQVAFDFGGLTTADISRIEVLKGSHSARYGSEAVGGVIDIRSRRAVEEGQHAYTNVEYGSFDTRKASMSATSLGDHHEFALTFTHVESDGFSAADENQGNTEDDSFLSNRISANGAYTMDTGARVGFSFFSEDSEAEFDERGGVGGDGSPGNDKTLNDATAGMLFTEFDTGAIAHRMEASIFDAKRNSIFNGFPFIFTGLRRSVAWHGAGNIGPSTRLVVGVDATEEKSTQSFGFSASTNVVGVFAELTQSLGDTVDISATLRHDDHSRFGGETSGRLSAVWRAREDVIFRASAATGYRAPSNFELFSTSIFSLGDPTLQPEESRNYELGAEKRFGNVGAVRATAFYFEIDNVINFAFNPFTFLGGYAQVPGTATRKGIEIEGDIAISERVRATASYTYTDGKAPAILTAATSSNGWKTGAIGHVVTLGLNADITDRTSGAFTVRHVADRPALGDYTLANLTVTHEVSERAEAYVRVENLFGEEYQLVQGFGTSDLAIFAGVRASF